MADPPACLWRVRIDAGYGVGPSGDGLVLVDRIDERTDEDVGRLPAGARGVVLELHLDRRLHGQEGGRERQALALTRIFVLPPAPA